MPANGDFPLAQGIQHAQLFADGPRGKMAAQGALAFKDFFQINWHRFFFRAESHGIQFIQQLWQWLANEPIPIAS